MTEKKEIQKQRKKLKKEGIKYFTRPLKEYWKKNILKAITTFFFYAIITYTLFSTIQAVNYDIIYCDSSNNQYDGKLMDVYNPYVEWVNNNINPTYMEPSEAQKSTIKCNYNITRWKKEPLKNKTMNTLKNMKTVLLKQ